MTDPDGIGEVFEETVRVAASAVATGRMIAARGHEAQLIQARADSEQQARVLQARHATERASALSELAVIDQQVWWETATGADVEHAWAIAQRWRDREPTASRAAVTLRAEHRRRTGIDLEQQPGVPQPDLFGDDAELAEVRRLSDASFPEPARAAVAGSPPGPPRARTARRDRTSTLQRERAR